jgi:hypothetical protein
MLIKNILNICFVIVMILLGLSSTEVLADQESRDAVVSSINRNVETSPYSKTTKLDEGCTRWMAVSLNNDEKYVMVGGTAKECGDSASVWNSIRYVNSEPTIDNDWYDGKVGVLFRGIQKSPNQLIAKTYRPVFKGDAEIRGTGTGPKRQYTWTVNVNEPIAKGQVTVKCWFAVSHAYIIVSADRVPVGPAVMPTNIATQVGIQELYNWWLQQCGRLLWNQFLDGIQNMILNLLNGDIVDYIESLQSFVDAINNRINIIQAGLTNSYLAGSTLESFNITGNSSGAVSISYTRNGQQIDLHLQVNYTDQRRNPFFNIHGVADAIVDAEVIRQILQAGDEWGRNVNKEYQKCIIQTIKQRFGENVDVIFP